MYLADARHDNRWPDYLPKAVEKGLRSQLALRLFNEDQTLGGSTCTPRPAAAPPQAIQLAELFAAHASIALGRKRFEHQLTEAVASRQVIGTAVGILMERDRGAGFPVPRQDLEDQQPQGPPDRTGARRLQQRPLRTYRPLTSAARRVDLGESCRVSPCGPQRRERSRAALRPGARPAPASPPSSNRAVACSMSRTCSSLSKPLACSMRSRATVAWCTRMVSVRRPGSRRSGPGRWWPRRRMPGTPHRSRRLAACPRRRTR